MHGVVYREYFRRLYDIIEEMLGSQSLKIEQVAGWMAESISTGGIVHLFGSGHYHVESEEVFHGAGGLRPLNPMLVPILTLSGVVNSTLLERSCGYSKVVLGTDDIRPGEIVI